MEGLNKVMIRSQLLSLCVCADVLTLCNGVLEELRRER